MSGISRKEAAEKIKQALEADDREQFEASVWSTPDGEKVRVYVRDMGYANAKDRGFIGFLKSGEIESHLLRNSGYAFDVAKNVISDIKIEPWQFNQRLTESEVQTELSKEKRQNNSKSEWCFGAADEESF